MKKEISCIMEMKTSTKMCSGALGPWWHYEGREGREGGRKRGKGGKGDKGGREEFNGSVIGSGRLGERQLGIVGGLTHANKKKVNTGCTTTIIPHLHNSDTFQKLITVSS